MWVKPVVMPMRLLFVFQAYVYFLFVSLYLFPLIVMTVSYVIIIVIIWKRGAIIQARDQHPLGEQEKSRVRRLLSSKRSTIHGTSHPIVFERSYCHAILLDDRLIESSLYNARSLGVIPRAKIKTVKMTLVIVIGESNGKFDRLSAWHVSAFTACWSPYFLLNIMNSLNLIENFTLIRVTSSLCYMNSLANPLIYWLFETNFCFRCR
jgi:hypothetical protein